MEKLFSKTSCDYTKAMDFIEQLSQGTADFEIEMILNAYIFKKNIRIYYLNSQASPDKIFLNDLFLSYDLNNEHNVVKIFLKSNHSCKI